MQKLLIVEDEAELAASLASTLRSKYEVAVVPDPVEALAKLKSFRPDLVLLDIILPRGTGLQVLEQVAGTPNGPRVLVMSGYAPDLDLSRFEHVVAGVLSKPFKLADVRQRVEEALSRPLAADTGSAEQSGGSILLVDDDPDVADQFKHSLRRRGYQVTVVSNAAAALSEVARRPFHLVVSDWILPGMSGTELLQELRRVAPDLPVILLSGYATLDFARRALRLGAVDVLPKPLPPKALHLAVEKGLLRGRAGARPSGTAGDAGSAPGGSGSTAGANGAASVARGSANQRQGRAGTRFGLEDILGASLAMENVRHSLVQVAPLHSTVLITGETGTGKELVAQALHKLSIRRDRPFVAVNAAAIPESLLESELFGYGSGAFTGAKRDGHPGKFVQASGGTLFLDEIGDLPLQLQGKLLRVLEEGEVDPVGGSGPRRVDVRVVAATHRDLEAMVRSGGFRPDLFYRLDVVHLALPPLRERLQDLPLLAEHFLAQFAQQYGVPPKTLAPATLEQLRAYAWPGNVRQLRNVIEQAFAFATGDRIEPEHLPGYVHPGSAAAVSAVLDGERGVARPGATASPTNAAEGRADTAERVELQRALAACGGNKVRAARLLGISRATLYVRLKLYGLL